MCARARNIVHIVSNENLLADFNIQLTDDRHTQYSEFRMRFFFLISINFLTIKNCFQMIYHIQNVRRVTSFLCYN